MGLLANSFTELSSRITNFKVQLVCNIEHQEMSSAQGDKIEPVHYENSFEIGANGDRVGLLKLEKSL